MTGTVWRIYWAAWLINIALILVDILWGARVGLSFEQGDVMRIALRCAAGLAIAAGLLAFANSRRLRFTRRGDLYRDAATGIFWILTLALFTGGALVFQYLSVSLRAPDISSVLVAADARLGLNWPVLYAVTRDHPWVNAALAVAYQSAFAQMALVPFILIVTRNVRDYAEFVVQFMVGSVLVLAIATPFPAESAFVHFHVPDTGAIATVSDFHAFRSGHMRALSFASLQGLVSFPSFHTVMAVLLTYALRHVKSMFPVFLGLNVCMIISTPVHGGHYFSDVIAGFIVGLAAVWMTRKLLASSAPSAAALPALIGERT